MEHRDLERQVREVIREYMEAWKAPFSDLNDLDSLEREELFNVIQDELGMAMDQEEFDELMMRGNLHIEDIVDALEVGMTVD